MPTFSKLMTPCMACDHDVKFASMPKIGFKVTCKNCETEYVVVSLNPIELEWVVEEDDDDDYRDYDDYEEFDDYDDDDDDYDYDDDDY